MFNFTIRRSSNAISQVNCDLTSGFVLVTFKSGNTYGYTDVSKRAILNLMMNKNMSLGFWVNENCVNKGRGKYAAIPEIMLKGLTFA